MDKHAQATYLREIASQCRFALNAVAGINAAMTQLRSRNRGLAQAGLHAEVFRSVHSFLTHASNISRMLWPQGGGAGGQRPSGWLAWLWGFVRPSETQQRSRRARLFRRTRGATLRQQLEIADGNHVLRSRTLRDHLEHFDERLDDWAQTSPNRNYVQDSIGRWGKDIVGIDVRDTMRWFDPQEQSCFFRGDRIDLQQLATAISDLLPKAEARADALWREAAAEALAARHPQSVRAA
jgi:hypothetical protein